MFQCRTQLIALGYCPPLLVSGLSHCFSDNPLLPRRLSPSPSHVLLCCHQHRSGGTYQTQSKDQAYLFEHRLCSLFDLSYCLARAALPLRLPCACFSFLLQLYSTTSNGMAYSIRYAQSWQHDRGWTSLALSLIFLFFFHFDSSAPPRREAQWLLSTSPCRAPLISATFSRGTTLPPQVCLGTVASFSQDGEERWFIDWLLRVGVA